MATIAFRTTAGKQIGFGHLRRCLTLAVELRRAGGAASPICFWVDSDPAAVAVAAAAGFEARLLAGPEPDATAAWLEAGEVGTLVVDSYTVDPASFSAWRRRVGSLVAIDDLADRQLDVDVVVNGTPQAAQLNYRTAAGAQLLLGPRYALLRPHFRDLPARRAAPRVARVLVTLGGADPQSSTLAVVEAVQRALPEAALDVVIGPLFGPVPDLERRAAGDPPRLRLHRDLDDLSALMAAADLAVSGGGQTLYELAATGVPTVALCLADNQEPNIAALAGISLLSAGRVADSAPGRFNRIEEECRQLAADPALRQRMSDAGRSLIDGQGAGRVAEVILRSTHRARSVDHGPTFTARLAAPEDARFVWTVNNHPTTRAQSLSTGDIPWETHLAWFQARLARPDCAFLIGLSGEEPIGVARFDVAGGEAVVSLAVSADHRGRGLGGRLIRSITDLALARGDVRVAVAYTRPTNTTSRRAFAHNGYREVGAVDVGGVEMCRFEKARADTERPRYPGKSA